MKYCDGCNTKGQCKELFKRAADKRRYSKSRMKCPCNMCVVKMVCEDPCDEYKEYWYVNYYKKSCSTHNDKIRIHAYIKLNKIFSSPP